MSIFANPYSSQSLSARLHFYNNPEGHITIRPYLRTEIIDHIRQIDLVEDSECSVSKDRNRLKEVIAETLEELSPPLFPGAA
jgi:hypothetical protein